MYAVIYISRASADFDLPAIRSMLEKAKVYNREHEISGCILYHKEQFIQLIEGTEPKIRKLYENIRRDPRHEQVTTLFEGKVEDCLFATWAMAFYDLSGDANELTYKRMLMEAYLGQADVVHGNKEAMEILRNSTQQLLNKDDHGLFDAVRQVFS